MFHVRYLVTPLMVTVILIVFMRGSTRAFQCYVCDSKNDIECMESLPANSRLTPTDCTNITNAKFCIKTTNLYAGELGTKRFCSSNDHGNYCKYVKQQTGDREYRSCILTCNSENCNGANSVIFNSRAILSIGIPLMGMTSLIMVSLSTRFKLCN